MSRLRDHKRRLDKLAPPVVGKPVTYTIHCGLPPDPDAPEDELPETDVTDAAVTFTCYPDGKVTFP